MFYCIYNILGGLLIALRDTTELNAAHLFFVFQFSSNEEGLRNTCVAAKDRCDPIGTQ